LTLLRNHVVLMFIYAAATGVFFALLWKTTPRDRLITFVITFLSLFAGGIVVAWAMYALPLR
jgi:hypothetical protein